MPRWKNPRDSGVQADHPYGLGTSGTWRRVLVSTDGACRHNGTEKATGGWGVYFSDGTELNGALPRNELQTNQRAELRAILEALRRARTRERKSDWSQSMDQLQQLGYPLWITVSTDSKYAMSACTEWLDKWKENDFTTSYGHKVKNLDLIMHIDRLIRDPLFGKVDFKYVAAHSGDPGNEKADELANLAINRRIASRTA